MKETPQQYTQRVTSYVEGKQPLAIQAATPKKLERLIKGVPTAKLRKRPAPEKWSVSEILAHLADAEIVGGFRMRLILGAPGTPIAAFDQDSWVISRPLREARSSQIPRPVSCGSRSQSRACSNPSRPTSGSTTECTPSAARKPSSTSSACSAATTSTTCSRSSGSSASKWRQRAGAFRKEKARVLKATEKVTNARSAVEERRFSAASSPTNSTGLQPWWPYLRSSPRSQESLIRPPSSTRSIYPDPAGWRRRSQNSEDRCNSSYAH